MSNLIKCYLEIDLSNKGKYDKLGPGTAFFEAKK